MKNFILTLTACLLLNACGMAVPETSEKVSASNLTAAAPIVDQFSGVFIGTETGTLNGGAYSNTITLTISETGGVVTGTWITGSGNVGTISGTNVSGTITGADTEETDACSGHMVSNLTLSNGVITGTNVGNLVCGSINVTMNLVKQ